MFEPLHGPDPAEPLSDFVLDDFWFRLLILPARLPIGRMWQVVNQRLSFFDDVAVTIYEEGVGALILRLDPRYKVMVMRSRPHARMDVVGVEIAATREEALAKCVDLLGDHARLDDYLAAAPMSGQEVRQTIRHTR